MPEYIKCGLEAEDKEAAFEEMVDIFCRTSKLNIREEILKALNEREERMSTGIQKGIAIPHGKTIAVDKVFGVLGVSKKGIDYDALDGKPVYLILMILAPPVEAEEHLHLLQRMANLLRNPDFYSDLIGAAKAEDVVSILKRYEESDAFRDF